MGQDPSEIRREIEETRARMGDTAEALAYKADVPARVKDAVNDRVETVRGTIGDVVDSVKSSVTGAGGKVGSALGSARSRAGATLDDTTGKLGEGIGHVGHLGRHLPEVDLGAVRRGVGIAAENPLGLALGALAVGFLAGLMLPVTALERERVGPLRDELFERAQSVSGDAIEHGKAVVQETVDAVVSTAQQSAQQHAQAVIAGGLEPSTLMNNALEHGRAVLRETAQVAMQTAQQSVEHHGKHVMGEAAGTEQHESTGGDAEYGKLLD